MPREVILVVDDNKEIADFLSGSMLPSLGYDTLVAYSGANGLAMIQKHHRFISLLLTDLQLPDTTGLDMLRKMHDEGFVIPSILMTAHGSEQVAADAFRLGVEDYLTKPIDQDKLRSAISRALSVTRLRRETSRLNAELKERVSWLVTLAEVGRSVTSTLDIDDVLKRIVEAGVKFTRAEQGFIALADQEREQLQMRVVKNIDEDKVEHLRLPVSDATVSKALSSGQPVRISRADAEDPLKVSSGMLVTSLIHVPLFIKGKALGVLSVNNHTSVRQFTKIDEAMLVSLADYASVAFENARLYQQARQEINARKETERVLRETEERYSLAVSGARDGIWDWDLKDNKIHYSPKWKKMLGYKDDEIGSSPQEWFNRIHPDDVENTKVSISAHINGSTRHFASEHRMRHSDGSYRWVLAKGVAVQDDDEHVTRMAGSQTDITDRKRVEKQLLHDALHDSLTGLPNRTLFLDRLSQAIERSKRNEHYHYAVCFMDIDNFKDVNDSHGHLVGDEYLVVVANLLRKGLRATDTLARFGGDEFVVLLEDLRDPQNIHRITDWIQQKFAEPLTISGHKVTHTASIGVVLSTEGYEQADEMIRDADIAMYSAKSKGKAHTELFAPEMREKIMERISLEKDLRHAIDNEEIAVHYQPIVDFNTGKLVGFEALSRWPHPTQGFLNPGVFLPVAIDTGLIVDLDRLVIHKAIRQIQEWQEQLPPDETLTINVNISKAHFTNHDFVLYIKHILKDTGLEPRCLVLEITERTLVDNKEISKKVFNELEVIGVQFQIDDFGIGYSSLGYLSSFPINALKIDTSFIHQLGGDPAQEKVVQAIINLTQRLNANVIAEGVETLDQLEALREMGCTLGQGKIVSMPLKSSEAGRMIKRFAEVGVI